MEDERTTVTSSLCLIIRGKLNFAHIQCEAPSMQKKKCRDISLRSIMYCLPTWIYAHIDNELDDVNFSRFKSFIDVFFYFNYVTKGQWN